MNALAVTQGVVVVTGASTGIGRHAAETLRDQGFRVLAGARKPSDLESLRQSGVEPVEIDVASRESVTRAAARVADLLGDAPLVGLVNNAGVAMGGPLEHVLLDDVRRQFEVNTYGALAVTQAMLPFIRRPAANGRRGRIVNISSMAGRFVTPLLGPYCMSKHAMEAMSDSLRMELSPWGIGVVVIEPGVVKTPIWDKGDDELDRVVSSLSDVARERYGKSALALQKFFKKAGGLGVPVEVTSRAIVRAIVDEKPKLRVIIGKDAKLAVLLDHLVPRRIVDRVYRASLGF
jgi:NAD(P)-dependent dehydrogenase (short-subunit alcohol dehydrogenase family)